MRRNPARNRDRNDREQSGPQIVMPIGSDRKIIGVKKAAHPQRNMRNADHQESADEAADKRTERRDERALPEKNRADVAPAVTDRAQDRDLLDFRKHGHGEDIKNAETGEQNNQRNGNRGGEPQSQEELQIGFLAFLPAAGFVLKELLEMLRQLRRACRGRAICKESSSPDTACAKGAARFSIGNRCGSNRRRRRRCARSAATVKRQYSPLGESNCTGSPASTPSASARREPTITELGIIAKILELSCDDLLADISRAQMERRIDSEEIDRGGFKISPRGERAAQDRRAGNDIRESAG